MSGVQRLASGSGVRLALPLGASGRRRPLRRRVALALALLAVAAPAALVTSRTLLQRRAASAAIAASPREATRATPIAAEPVRPPPSSAAPQRPRPERVVASTHASALFAKHSWYVAPPPRPAPPPPPPPEPTAPALPFTFLGSYAPQGDAPVFFLARSDRVIDAHVGDRIDGVYQLESAGGGRLVFVYLPLNIRQNLAARVSP